MLRVLIKTVFQILIGYLFEFFGSLVFKRVRVVVKNLMGGNMFLDAFKKICDFAAAVVAIAKDSAWLDFARWISALTPLLLNAGSIWSGLKDFSNAVQDKAVVEECAKYFDSKFDLPGKLEDVDDDLAEVLLKCVSIGLKLLNKSADPA